MRFWRHREETTEAFADDAESPLSGEETLVEAPPVAPAPEAERASEAAEEHRGWFGRLRIGMARSSARPFPGHSIRTSVSPPTREASSAASAAAPAARNCAARSLITGSGTGGMRAAGVPCRAL